MNMNMSYCERCQEEKEYKIIENVKYEIKYENKIIKYIGKKAVCEVCGEELFVDEVEEYNQKAFEEAYKEQLEIISTNQIDEITKKYNIGKRPLSILLGWGETTIARYYQGYVPSLKKSNILKSILNNPNEYYNYLITNKDRISEAAFNKSIEAIESILKICDKDTSVEDKNITNVAKYIVNKIEITPMGLLKLLYYIQVFYSSFFKKAIFTSRCNAWKHGPVFGKIYYIYKEFKYNPIKIDNQDNIELEGNLKSIVDNVIKFFGCYSAKVLEFFTHNEEPWLNAKDKEDNTIEKSTMKNFGEKILEENNINSIDEIYKYSFKMYGKYVKHLLEI